MNRQFTFYAIVKLDELLAENGGAVARDDLGEAMSFDTGSWGEFPDDEDAESMGDDGVQVVLDSLDTASRIIKNDLWKKMPPEARWS